MHPKEEGAVSCVKPSLQRLIDCDRKLLDHLQPLEHIADAGRNNVGIQKTVRRSFE